MDLAARWPSGLSARIWIVWAAVAVGLTIGPFRWHIEYFRSPGPAFHQAILIAIPALAAACYAYCRLRTRTVRALEPAALALVVLLPSFFYEPGGALAAGFLLAGAAAWGGAALALLDLEPGEELESVLLSVGAGLGVLIVLLFLIGVAGFYRWEVFAALLGAPVILRRRKLFALFGRLRAAAGGWPDDADAANALAGASVFFTAVFLLIAVALALAPSVAHDALLMHLPAVRVFAETGSLHPLPFQPYSLYPQGAETLMTVAYTLGGQPAAQFVHPLFFALALGAVFLGGRQLGFNRAACFLASAALLAVPFLLWDGSVIKNDLAVVAFQLLAVSCALGSRSSSSTSRLRLGVFFLASSLAIKYTSFFGLPWIALLLLWGLRGRPGKIREVGFWTLIFGVTAVLWQVRASRLHRQSVFSVENSAKRWATCIQG